MAEISDILKIGKDKYLEKNIEQKCYNPFREWIFGEFICFRAYIETVSYTHLTLPTILLV